MMERIYIGSDHTLRVDGAKSASDGSFINSGTATYTLTDGETGSVVTTGTLTYTASSDGDYSGVVDRSTTSELVEGRVYYADAVVSGGGGDVQKRYVLLASYDTGEQDCN